MMLALAAALLYAVTFTVLRLRLYDGLYVGLWDQGFIQQALYNTLHGAPLAISMSHEGYQHLFAEHTFLFALVLLPFYAIVPHPATLFVLEALAGAAGGVAVFFLARKRLGNGWLALTLAAAYLLHPTLQWANLGLVWYGFHLENFFPPLFLLGVLALEHDRKRTAFALFALALSVIEVYAIPIALFGLYLGATRPGSRWFGLALLALATVWFVAATQLVIPQFRGGLAPRQFSGIGLLVDLVRDGGLTAYLAAHDAAAFEYLRALLKPVGLLPLAGPAALLVAVPSLLLNFLGPLVGNDLPTRPQAWYAAPLLPFLFLATIDGTHNLLRWAKHFEYERVAVRAVPLLLIAATLASSYAESPLPFARASYLDPQWLYYVAPRAGAVEEMQAAIPPGASVSAEFFVGSHLLNRRALYWFPKEARTADYVALDLAPRFALSEGDVELVRQLRADPDHEVVVQRDDFLLLRKKTAMATYPPVPSPLSAGESPVATASRLRRPSLTSPLPATPQGRGSGTERRRDEGRRKGSEGRPPSS